MPDHPYVYPSPPLHPVQTGGTRVRVTRRKRREDTSQPEKTTEKVLQPSELDNEAAWEQLLVDAVTELNASFQHNGAPFTCTLEEEDESFILLIQHESLDGTAEDIDEEILSPAELPQWLARLRLRLGLLVDETA